MKALGALSFSEDEKKIVEIRKTEERVGLTAATLPWWAKVLIVRHAEAAFSTVIPQHLHRCFDCGCVLLSTSTDFQYFPDLCLKCDKKSQLSQGGN